VGEVRGEARADYEWVFRSSFSRVHRTVFLVLRDYDRAEEITQDAFLKLLENWRKVSAYEQPEAWVRRVAIRMAVRQAGREISRPWREDVAVRSMSREPAEPDVDLADAIGRLAPRQRAAVVLHYYEDLPVLEVARVLNVAESTVKEHLQRARIRLAEVLGEEVPRADR
jgi:RNA polymerase sigma-70 factor (ECF subfamily)